MPGGQEQLPALRLVDDRPAHRRAQATPVSPGNIPGRDRTAPALRIRQVDTPREPDDDLVRRARRIADENRRAAGLSETDARWVLAVRTSESLEGGDAAILTPARRRTLMLLAARMGLRPFDSSLIIAIVQDAARSGGSPLTRSVEDRLTLIRPAEGWPGDDAPRDLWVGRALSVAICLSSIILWAMLSWLLR